MNSGLHSCAGRSSVAGLREDWKSVSTISRLLFRATLLDSQPELAASKPMLETTATILTLDELRHFVHAQLCARESLLEDQFKTIEHPLTMRGRHCGRQFQLHGPRSIRLGAIWASDQNLIYFYDTQGERYHKVRLTSPVADAA